MDNLFTSFPLLEKLSEMGIAGKNMNGKLKIDKKNYSLITVTLHYCFLTGTGTVRQNRLNKVPIPKKKDVEKKTVERGFSKTLFNDDQVLVVWKDNKAVYMASNKHDDAMTNTCRRFCREKRAFIQVPIPAMVEDYNSKMGGVDLLDNLIACYR